MPITPSLRLNQVSDDEFAIIDEAVMRCAYAVQNKFGRLFDEQVYENNLAARLRAEGFEVYTQVPIDVTQHDQAAYQEHLNVLLGHTRLKSIQWINLNHSQVEITTIAPGVGSSVKAEE